MVRVGDGLLAQAGWVERLNDGDKGKKNPPVASDRRVLSQRCLIEIIWMSGFVPRVSPQGRFWFIFTCTQEIASEAVLGLDFRG